MCGIIGAVSYNKEFDLVDKIVEQYESQKSRGTMGFGFVSAGEKELIFTRTKDEKEALEDIQNARGHNVMLFHHRYPTCTPNVPDANHPLFITNKKHLKHKYFIIHNGVLNNHRSLKDIHEKEGWKYKTEMSVGYSTGNGEYNIFTDSESLGIEMAMHIEHGSKVRATGSVACLILQVDASNKPIAVFSYHNDRNPINFYTNQHGVFFSSTGKGAELPIDKLFRFTIETRTTDSRDLEVSSDYKRVEEEQGAPTENGGIIKNLLGIGSKSPETYIAADKLKDIDNKLLEKQADLDETEEEIELYKDGGPQYEHQVHDLMSKKTRLEKEIADLTEQAIELQQSIINYDA